MSNERRTTSLNTLTGQMVDVKFQDGETSVVEVQLNKGSTILAEVPQELASFLKNHPGQPLIVSPPIRDTYVSFASTRVKLAKPKSNTKSQQQKHKDPFGNDWVITITSPDTPTLQQYVAEQSIELFAAPITDDQYKRALHAYATTRSRQRTATPTRTGELRKLVVRVELTPPETFSYGRVQLLFNSYPASESWQAAKALPPEEGDLDFAEELATNYEFFLAADDAQVNISYEDVSGGFIKLLVQDQDRGAFIGSGEVEPVAVEAGSSGVCTVIPQISTRHYRLSFDVLANWNRPE